MSTFSVSPLLSPYKFVQDRLPAVDPIYQPQRATLFAHYQEHGKGSTGTIPDLTDGEVQIISERFSSIFSASNGAFTLQAAAENRSVREAESRHDWDALLYRFYIPAPKQALSTNVL